MGSHTSKLLWHCNIRPPIRPDDGTVMTIGQLSQRTGVTVKALRRYDGMGLLYTLGRSSAGYRLFDSSALACVDGIQSLRGLGLTEAEIAHLAHLNRNQPDEPIEPHLVKMLRAAHTRLSTRIEALTQVRRRIEESGLDPAPRGRP